MLRRRARCILSPASSSNHDASKNAPLNEKLSDKSTNSDEDDSEGDNIDFDTENMIPPNSFGVVNLYQAEENSPVDLTVILQGLDDGQYSLSFTYDSKCMGLYEKALQEKIDELPKLRSYENPRPPIKIPKTINGVGRERCPDRRIIGGIEVSKGCGTLILSDRTFNLFNDTWTPVGGVFHVSAGTEKLGKAYFADPATAIATGKVELDLTHFQSGQDELALQRALRPRTLRQMVTGVKSRIPFNKALPLLMAGENRLAFKILGRFSFAMFCIPLILFFAIRIMAADHPYKDVLSGGVAIFAVNIIIGVYALVAYKEAVLDEAKSTALSEKRQSISGSQSKKNK